MLQSWSKGFVYNYCTKDTKTTFLGGSHNSPQDIVKSWTKNKEGSSCKSPYCTLLRYSIAEVAGIEKSSSSSSRFCLLFGAGNDPRATSIFSPIQQCLWKRPFGTTFWICLVFKRCCCCWQSSKFGGKNSVLAGNPSLLLHRLKRALLTVNCLFYD